MNIIQQIKNIWTAMSRIKPLPGRNISIDSSPDGSTISCLLDPYPHACSVFVRNATGEDLPRGTVLAVTGIVEPPPAESDIDVEALVFSVAIPDAGSRPVTIAILMEDVSDGCDGRAAISGTVAAKLTRTPETGENWAFPNGQGKLEPSSEGIVGIIDMGEQSERQSDGLWAVAFLSSGSNGGSAKGMFTIVREKDENDQMKCRIVNGNNPKDENCGIAHLNSQPFEVKAIDLPLKEGVNRVYLKWMIPKTESDTVTCAVKVTPKLKYTTPLRVYYLIGTVNYTPENGNAPAKYIIEQQHHPADNIYATWYGPCLHLLDVEEPEPEEEDDEEPKEQ